MWLHFGVVEVYIFEEKYGFILEKFMTHSGGLLVIVS